MTDSNNESNFDQILYTFLSSGYCVWGGFFPEATIVRRIQRSIACSCEKLFLNFLKQCYLEFVLNLVIMWLNILNE